MLWLIGVTESLKPVIVLLPFFLFPQDLHHFLLFHLFLLPFLFELSPDISKNGFLPDPDSLRFIPLSLFQVAQLLFAVFFSPSRVQSCSYRRSGVRWGDDEEQQSNSVCGGLRPYPALV